jgi:hypothetical protein
MQIRCPTCAALLKAIDQPHLCSRIGKQWIKWRQIDSVTWRIEDVSTTPKEGYEERDVVYSFEVPGLDVHTKPPG